MHPRAWLSLDAAEPVAVGHGGVIGRLSTAALRIDDGRVSEAHAMVSLRGQSLLLLSLRGRLRTRTGVVGAVELTAGVEVELADSVVVHCHTVDLPDAVLALAIDGAPPVVLRGTTSIVGRPRSAFVPGFDPAADAVVWAFDDGWSVRLPDGGVRSVAAGDSFVAGDSIVEAVEVALDQAGTPRTRRPARPRLTLTCFDVGVTAAIGDADAVHIGGLQGALLQTLARAGSPVMWTEIAEALWPDDRSAPDSIRRRFDATVARTRQRLKALGLPENRIVLDHAGSVRLVTRDGDRVHAKP